MTPLNGQRIARRHVTRNGDALTVIVPRPFQFLMGLRRGDVLELRLFEAEQGFRVRAVKVVPREDIEHWPDLGDQVLQRK